MAPEVSTPFLPGILTAYRAMVRYPKVHYKIQFAQDQDAATLEVNHHFQKWWFQNWKMFQTPTKKPWWFRKPNKKMVAKDFRGLYIGSTYTTQQ